MHLTIKLPHLWDFVFENLGIKTIESKIERLPTSRLLTSKILPDGHQGAHQFPNRRKLSVCCLSESSHSNTFALAIISFILVFGFGREADVPD